MSDHVLSGINVLISGCSRGIGLGLVKAFLAAGATVIATCRNPHTSTDLQELSVEYKDRITIAPLNVDCEDSFKALKKSLLDAHFTSLDVVIANAGVSNKNHPVDPPLTCSIDDMTQVYRTNVVGTMLLFQTFSDMIIRGKGKLFVPITSRLGSIELTYPIGGYTSYRVSKAALNMLIMTMASDATLRNNGVKFICMHPGWVETDMGGLPGKRDNKKQEEKVEETKVETVQEPIQNHRGLDPKQISVHECTTGICNMIEHALNIQHAISSKDINNNSIQDNITLKDFIKEFTINNCVFTSYDGEMLPW